MIGIVSDLIGCKKIIGIVCVVCIGGIIMQYFLNLILMIFGGKLILILGFGFGYFFGLVFVVELVFVKMCGLCLVFIVSLLMKNILSVEIGQMLILVKNIMIVFG